MSELTRTQRKKIRKYLSNVPWTHINNIILTEEQRTNPEKMKIVVPEMRRILRDLATMFGTHDWVGKIE